MPGLADARDGDALIFAVLRGDAPAWPRDAGEDAVASFLARCAYHGVEPLLHERLEHSEWPADLLGRFRQDARLRAMWELRHRQQVCEALAALSAAGSFPVVFKGTALAYSLYTNAVLRPRGDTDVLVLPSARGAAQAALAALGFTREPSAGGDLSSHQATYSKTGAGGELHAIDLHWRINNSNVLANLLSHEEMRRDAEAASRLGAGAFIASPAHALLLACLHRGSHRHNPYHVDGEAHYGGDRAIWLYDIHLLATTLAAPQWAEVLRLARERGLMAVTLEALRHSEAYLGTPLPHEVVAALDRGGGPELPALYLAGTARRQQWMDFRAIAGARNKLRFLRELAFPPAAYVRHKYAGARPDWLAWLYLRRALAGVRKRLVTGRSGP